MSKMLLSGLHMALDLALLFWSYSCLDDDTAPVAAGQSSGVSADRAGDRVWSYNVETGELALKAGQGGSSSGERRASAHRDRPGRRRRDDQPSVLCCGQGLGGGGRPWR